MTDKSKKILKKIFENCEKLNDSDKEAIAIFAEGMANVRDRVKQEVA